MSDAHLLADIGGTYARFAIRRGAMNGTASYANVSYLQVADHHCLADAAEHYLQAVPGADRPTSAVIAVASAVTSDEIRFSNSPWRFSIRAFGERLGLTQVRVVNDFAAIAWSLPALAEVDLASLGGERRPSLAADQVQLVVGPGTGLGLAAVKRSLHGPVILDSEGGHSGFAPRNALERELLERLASQFGRVSYERILSGAGLVNVHAALSEIHGLSARPMRPEQVTEGARRGEPIAVQTIQCFCSAFGSFAGDAVLVFGAWDGVYLAGEMLGHVFDPLTEVVFRQAFEDKGRFSEQLRQVPTLRIVRPDVGLLGVCALSQARDTSASGQAL